MDIRNIDINILLSLTNQNKIDFHLNHTNGRIHILSNYDIVMKESFYKGKTAQEVTSNIPKQKYFYRAMSYQEAYIWINWINCRDTYAYPCPLNLNDPLCLASFVGYSLNYMGHQSVLIEFCAPDFAKKVFDINDLTKIHGLKAEGTEDYSWGLSIKTQMSCDSNYAHETIKSLPYEFRKAVKNKGYYKIVAYSE